MSTAMGSTLASAPGMYPRLRFPAPPTPGAHVNILILGPVSQGGLFRPRPRPPGAGTAPGHSDYRWDTAARRTPTARPYLGRFRFLDKSVESRVRDAVRTEGGPFFRGRGGRGGAASDQTCAPPGGTGHCAPGPRPVCPCRAVGHREFVVGETASRPRCAPASGCGAPGAATGRTGLPGKVRKVRR